MYIHITYEPITLCTELWGVLGKCKFKILWYQGGWGVGVGCVCARVRACACPRARVCVRACALLCVCVCARMRACVEIVFHAVIVPGQAVVYS